MKLGDTKTNVNSLINNFGSEIFQSQHLYKTAAAGNGIQISGMAAFIEAIEVNSLFNSSSNGRW